MTAVVKNILQKFAELFGEFLDWFIDNFSDSVVRDAILKDLGLTPVDGDVPDAGEIATQLQGERAVVKAFAEARAEEADAASVAAVIDSIVKIADVVTDVIEAARSDAGVRSRVELFAAMLEIWALETMAARSKLLYHVSRSVGAVNDAAGNIDWVQLGALFGVPPGETEERKDPWADQEGVFAVSQAIGATIATVVGILASLRHESLDDVFEFLYGWEPEPTDTSPTEAERVASRTLTVRYGGETAKAALTTALVPVVHGGPGIVVAPGGSLTLTEPVELDGDEVPEAERRIVDLTLNVQAAAGGVFYIPLGEGARDAETLAPGSLDVTAGARPRGGRYVLGSSDGVRLELGAPALDFTLTPGGLGFHVGLGDSALVVSKGDGDALVQDQLPDEALRIPFSLGVGYDSRHGWALDGGTGLAVSIPVQQSRFGFRIQYLQLALEPPGAGPRQALTLETSTAIGFRLGGFSASLDRIGFETTLDWSGDSIDFSVGYRPPAGIGLSLDFGFVKGGGYLYFDFDRHEYAGALALTFKRRLTIQAVGFLTTELPDTDDYALFISLSARFSISITSGFFWTGVGGMLGHNHGVAIDKLQAGLRTKALDDVLFPTDLVANAPRILATLRSVFPIQPGSSLLGIVLEFTWGAAQLIKLRLGVIVQYGDNGSRITLLGQFKITAPDEKTATAKINVDFIGDAFWDDKGHRLAFDARIYDSKLAEFTLTGSVVARSVQRTTDDGEEESDWLVAVGGFHPRYKVSELITETAPVPKQDRAGFSAKKGIAKLTFEAYVAISANSFQFGARVQLVAKKSGFSAEAVLGLDVIFITEPCFHFVADIEARAAIKKGSRTLMGVDLRLGLSGPKPWNARGKATFRILFVKFTIGFDEEWGELCEEELPLIELENLLADELGADYNWGGLLSLNGHEVVSFGERREEKTGVAVSHPLGSLEFRQRTLPLGLDLAKVGRGLPATARRVEITAARIAGQPASVHPVHDQFAPGQYFDLTEEEKLTRPSFERLTSGFAVSATGGVTAPAGVSRKVEYETIELFPEGRKRLGTHVMEFVSVLRAVRYAKVAFGPSSTEGPLRPVRSGVIVSDADRYVVAGVDALEPADAASPGSYEAAKQRARALGRRVQVVELHEVAP